MLELGVSVGKDVDMNLEELELVTIPEDVVAVPPIPLTMVAAELGGAAVDNELDKV